MIFRPINNIERFIYLALFTLAFGMGMHFKISKELIERDSKQSFNNLNNIKHSLNEMEDLNILQDSVITGQINIIKQKEAELQKAILEGTITKEEADIQIAQLKKEVTEIKEEMTNQIVADRKQLLLSISQYPDTVEVKKILTEKVFMPNELDQNLLIELNENKKKIHSLTMQLNDEYIKNEKLTNKIAVLNKTIDEKNELLGERSLKKLIVEDLKFKFTNRQGKILSTNNLDKGNNIESILIYFDISKFSTVNTSNDYKLEMKYFGPNGNEVNACRRSMKVKFRGENITDQAFEFHDIYGYKPGKHVVKFYDDSGEIAEASFYVSSYD